MKREIYTISEYNIKNRFDTIGDVEDLVELRLEIKGIPKGFEEDLPKLLLKLPKLEVLELENLNISKTNSLCYVLEKSNIKYLKLVKCGLSSEHLSEICQALKNCKTLEGVYICSSQLGQSDNETVSRLTDSISSLINEGKITNLVLAHLNINTTILYNIINALTNTLQDLYILCSSKIFNSEKIESFLAECVCKGVKQTRLILVDLNENKIKRVLEYTIKEQRLQIRDITSMPDPKCDSSKNLENELESESSSSDFDERTSLLEKTKRVDKPLPTPNFKLFSEEKSECNIS